jgi:DNA-binding beta-propeller fold protein YncE
MRKLTLLLIAATAAFLGCSGDSPSEPPVIEADPVLAVTPSDGAMDQPFENLELVWRRYPGAEGYDVFFGKPGSLVQVASYSADTSYAVPDELEFDTEYRWRVVPRSPEESLATTTFRFLVRTCHGLTGRVCTWAGTGVQGRGEDGMPLKQTALNIPQGVDFDSDGNPYVVDWNNHRVLIVDAENHFKTLIGGDFGDGPDGQADEIGLNHPTHVTFAPNGDLVLSAWHNSILKRMDMSTHFIRTFCGDGSRAFGGDGGPAEDALLDLPVHVLFDAAGNMYVGDQANMRIRRIDAATGYIETLVGSGPVRTGGYAGDGGPANQARLAFEAGQAATPSGRFCFDGDENIYIADTGNHCVRIVTRADGMINTIAGQPQTSGYGGDGGQATAALLREPRDVFYDGGRNVLYIADTGNHCIRQLDLATGVITTAVGTPTEPGRDDLDGKFAADVHLDSPYGVEVGPQGNVWITDTSNNLIRIYYP